MPADRLIHPKLGHSDKVNQLSDLEYRVWTTYLLTADDYGVMRKSAVTIQAAHEALNQRKPALIDAALKRLVALDLVQMFVHQGRKYIYTRTWQNFQRVKHPRDTMQPAPPAEALEKCSHATRQLFVQHPSNRSEELPQDFGNISETLPQGKSELGSLARARTREMANGTRPTANGSEGVQGEAPPFDNWWLDLTRRYPANRVTNGHTTQIAFLQEFERDGRDPSTVWSEMMAGLENQKAGHEWRVKGMVPRLEKWLTDGLWRQRHEVAPVSERVSDKTSRTMTSAAEFIKAGQRGA